MYYNYTELHQAVKCKKSGENQKAKALWSSKQATDKGNALLRSGQCAEDSSKIPCDVGPAGNPLEEPWQAR